MNSNIGVDRDYETAAFWYKEASKQGCLPAKKNVNNKVFKKELKKELKLKKKNRKKKAKDEKKKNC